MVQEIFIRDRNSNNDEKAIINEEKSRMSIMKKIKQNIQFGFYSSFLDNNQLKWDDKV